MCQKNIAEVPTVTSVTHFREKENTVLRMTSSSLFVIGHVIEGEKEIFTGENVMYIHQGETYLLCIGNHYSKNLISSNSRFEELMITIKHDDILKANNQVVSSVHDQSFMPCTQCTVCKTKRFIPIPESPSLPLFFSLVISFMGDSYSIAGKPVMNLIIPSLLYILYNNPNKCVKGKILAAKETEEEIFKATIRDSIFSDETIESLALKTGYSISMFKKKFKSLFGAPPHVWVNKERLKYAKLLLQTTQDPIDDIGKICYFPNISHFSRIFKKEYGVSPTQYRLKFSSE